MLSPNTAQCLLCGGPSAGRTYPFGTRWDGQAFEYHRCARCASAFIHPVPSPDQFERMYDRSTYHDTFYDEVAEEAAASFLPQVESCLKAGGRLLDFGCGNGTFLRAASRRGFPCDGVELEAKAREQAAANSGCEVFSLDQVKASGRRYDIIYMGDVLEHLPAPAAMLRELEPLLAPDGRFFIEGPLEDNASLVYYAARAFGGLKKLAGKPLLGASPPFHMFRTSAAGQRRFFESVMGYRVLRFLTDETGWPYVSGDAGLFAQPSAGRAVRHAIGQASVGLGRLLTPLGARFGNRFAAVLSPA